MRSRRFQPQARGNQENLVVYRGCAPLVASFSAEYERIWAKFAPKDDGPAAAG